jgi:hypothetical protein
VSGAIDFRALIKDAVVAPEHIAALAVALAPLVADAVIARINATQSQTLLPLAKILSISPRAALGRLSRDAELRTLGHRLGRRLVFRPNEVHQLLAQRQRERVGTGAQ